MRPGRGAGPILHRSIYPRGEVPCLHTATSALVGYHLMRFNKEPGLRQVKYLSAGHDMTWPLKWQATLVALGWLVGMDPIGVLKKAKRLTRMAGLSAWFFTSLFG